MDHSKLEEKIYNEGERLIPGVTHGIRELIRHTSSYVFFKKVIELDMESGTVSKPVRIVDLGCGVGHGCYILSKIPGAQVLGVDISPESLEYARKYYSKKNISYQLADLKEFVSAMTEYDYVVSRGVMEHIPNGLHIISTAKWRHRLLFDVPYDEPAGNPHHQLVGIRVKDFSEFPEAELFYEDLEGVVCDIYGKPSKPNMIMCVCCRPGLRKLLKNSRINFPVPAWRPGEGIKEGNNINWFEREELIPFVVGKLQTADVVLDIGCGIRPQNYVRPLVHICCEPFEQYVDQLRKQVLNEYDRYYVTLKATWAEAVKLFPLKSVDSVFLIDVIEHLEKDEALRLLKATERLVRKQIVIFTPLGFMPQKRSYGKDAWGLDGGVSQEHKSGWHPEEFDDTWDIYASRVFHTVDNMGRELEVPYGALWAIKTIDKIETKDRRVLFKKQKIRTLFDLAIDIRVDILLDLFIITMRFVYKILKARRNNRKN
jgi:2-polyprenyl-3-methyl-5-hydroxy-6-metoxy-1,4-benzoquinol methylase